MTLAGLRLAVGTFTVLPVRAVEPTPAAARSMMLIAPAVGLALGAVAAGVSALVTVRIPPGAGRSLLGAALAVTALTLLTRALHLDGLADTADGLGSLLPPDAARAVMRRGDVGPFGVAAIVHVLVVQVAALTLCAERGRGGAALVTAAAAGRLAATLSCTTSVPAADAAGLGALVAGRVGRVGAGAVTALTLTAVAAVAAGWGGTALAAQATVAVIASLGVATGLRRHAVRRLGGITGDVLGAQVELGATVVLVAMAL